MGKKKRLLSVSQVIKLHPFYALENLVDLTLWPFLWTGYFAFHGEIDWAIWIIWWLDMYIQTIWLVYQACYLQNCTRVQQWQTRDWMVLFSLILNIRIKSNVVLFTYVSFDVYMHMIYSRWSRSWCRTKTRIRMLLDQITADKSAYYYILFIFSSLLSRARCKVYLEAERPTLLRLVEAQLVKRKSALFQ